MSNYASMRLGSSAGRQISSSIGRIPNPARPTPTLPPRPGATNSAGTPYVGINNTRQGKFEARSDRRRGDWSILEFAMPWLWLDAACLAEADEGLGCPAPDIIADLWP